MIINSFKDIVISEMAAAVSAHYTSIEVSLNYADNKEIENLKKCPRF